MGSRIILTNSTLIVVQVPEVLFSLPGRPGRRIFIEAFDPADKLQAQKDAVALGRIMKERIFNSGKTADDRPLVLPANLEGTG